jgi:long-subunit fatty acid transport protein
MKKIILFSIVCAIFSISIFAQEIPKQKSEFWKKVQFGGGITLNFTNNASVFGIAPSAIYNFNDKFSSGVSISYLRTKYKNLSAAYNSYGGSVLTLYNPFKGLQLSGEYEQTYVTYNSLSREIPALFLGVGYTYGRNVAVGLRYDALYDEDISLYPSAITPFVRIYF